MKRNIGIVIILISLLLSCQKKKSTEEIEESIDIKELSYFLCKYASEKSIYEKKTAKKFEIFLISNFPFEGKNIIEVLKSKKHWLITIEDSLFILNNDMLHRKDEEYLDLSPVTGVSLNDCGYEKIIHKQIVNGNYIIEALKPTNSLELKQEIRKMIHSFYLSKILKGESEFLFKPRKDEKPKISAIQLKKIGNSWGIFFIYLNHELLDIENLSLAISEVLKESEVVKEYGVTNVLVPIKYFERYQLEKIDTIHFN